MDPLEAYDEETSTSGEWGAFFILWLFSAMGGYAIGRGVIIVGIPLLVFAAYLAVGGYENRKGE